jgi:amino acid adenylation domain-containing protein
MHMDNQCKIESLSSEFLKSVQNFGSRPALEVEGRIWSYNELHDLATRIAATLAKYDTAGNVPLTAVFAYRSIAAYAGVLAALFRGHGYVPLNRTFPVDRTKSMLVRAGCGAVIVDPESAVQLEQILQGVSNRLVLVFPTLHDVRSIADRWPNHTVVGAQELEKSFAPKTSIAPDLPAYLLFTSGSTGLPKGVLVAQRNVNSYLHFVAARYCLNEADRCSQTFDMTFDLSAHDMFLTWKVGACLCCPTQKSLVNPGKFITDSRLTVWFSVPSSAVFMKRFGILTPGKFPSLRLSLFCGEALPAEVARSWAESAPNSIIENIYGPTELTIACTAYRWDPVTSPPECENGLVPIGEPFDDMNALIVDENLTPVPDGSAGELILTGSQVALGYWNDPERTKKSFVVPPGLTETYYRTGDRVRRSGPNKPINYLGRMDNQMKILGHRVELGEVEAVLREESGLDGVVAVGWPVNASGADGVEAFLEADQFDSNTLRERVAARLPTYMAPRRIHVLPRFPLNSNGKYDRGQLLKILASMGTNSAIS